MSSLWSDLISTLNISYICFLGLMSIGLILVLVEFIFGDRDLKDKDYNNY